MPENSTARLISIDWGTSSLRVCRLGLEGEVLERRESDRGLMQIANGDFAGALAEQAGDWIDASIPVIASGMVTSRQGWLEVPYVSCPVALDQLANSMASVSFEQKRADKTAEAAVVHLVPGVDCIRDDGLPDVMRGEETQLLGCEAQSGDIIVMPGTHSKWVLMNSTGIETFYTCMTGELYGVMTTHSILGKLISNSRDNADAFERGVERAKNSGGRVIADLFGARSLALADQLAPESIASWLSGLLLGAEIAQMTERDGPIAQAIERNASVTIAGSAELTQRYSGALDTFGINADAVGNDVTARGHWEIAAARGLV